MQSKKGEILLLTNGAGTVGLPFKEKKIHLGLTTKHRSKFSQNGL